MITLVVAGIFFLLMMNNSGEGFSFTGALIGSVDNGSISEDSEGGSSIFGTSKITTSGTTSSSKTGTVEKALSKEVAKSKKEVAIKLNVNEVPDISSKATVSQIELRFSDLTAEIEVNKDKLELNGLKEGVLKVKDFKGTVDFTGKEFSLDGFAKRIEINDVALASKGDLKISFEGLKYNYFNIAEIELNNLEFQDATGTLNVGEKLQYTLSDDDITAYYYRGTFVVDGNSSDSVNLDGTARGVSLSGSELDVNIN